MNLPLNNRGYDDHETARRDTEAADIRKNIIVEALMQNATFSSLKSDTFDYLVEHAAKILKEYFDSDEDIDIEFIAWLLGFELDIPEHKGIIAGTEHYLYSLLEG